MNLLALLRKGFGYFLMSMGVSSPEAAKNKPATRPGTKSGHDA